MGFRQEEREGPGGRGIREKKEEKVILVKLDCKHVRGV